MNLVSRSIVTVTAGFTLVGLAACGNSATGGTTPPSSQPAGGLASLDPCKIISPQQLSADGLQSPGTPNNDVRAQPGCNFKGSNGLRVSFAKNQTETVDKYEHDGQWDSYTKTTVNGRPAARGQGAGTSGTSGCTVLMDAGGGVVLVVITDLDKTDDQACAEDMKYAQQVEPSLPK